ncbi:RNA polymerase sigma factor [Puia dinghuensis]|uniref:RNA polymerase sigma factor n=1 Tax=Puia dinghuensis TaxID=1792502 RepID=UPI0016693921|nr:sigma-70 family RNA polymerase sigma factor [Puia dinghuensis]
MDASAEHELLLSVARGDEKSFKQLVDIYWWPVYYNILTLTKSTVTAQEFTQDIFLKIWQKRALLAEVDNFMNYVFVAGKNHVISAMRKKVLDTNAALPDDLVETNNSPGLAMDYKETWDAILKVIDSMPKKQQQVMRMSRIEGLSNKEIAERTGLSPSAVKWHIVAGLNTIRIFLATRNREFLLILLSAAVLLY